MNGIPCRCLKIILFHCCFKTQFLYYISLCNFCYLLICLPEHAIPKVGKILTEQFVFNLQLPGNVGQKQCVVN